MNYGAFWSVIAIAIAGVSYERSIAATHVTQPETLPDGVRHWKASPNAKLPRFFGVFQPEIPQGTDLPFGKSAALLVGVSHYKYLKPQLPSVTNDLMLMREFLLSKAGFDDVYQIQDETVNRDMVERYVRSVIPKVVGPRGRIFFYFSGHGADGGGETGYMQFSEAEAGTFWGNTCVMEVDIVHKWSREVDVAHMLFMFDCCASGIAFDPKSGDEELLNLKTMSRSGSRVVLTAGTAEQKTYALTFRNGRGNGVLTEAFLSAFEHTEDRVSQKQMGFLTIAQIFSKIETRVGEFCRTHGVSIQPRCWPLQTGDSQSKYRGTFLFLDPNIQNPILSDDLKRAWQIPSTAKGSEIEKLVDEVGTIQLTSYVQGEVYIDQKRIGEIRKGDIRDYSRQKVGMHRLELKGDRGFVQDVIVGKGAVSEVMFTAKEEVSVGWRIEPAPGMMTGSLKLAFHDESGLVSIDGIEIGYLAAGRDFILRDLPVGEHTYLVTSKSANRKGSFKIESDKTTQVPTVLPDLSAPPTVILTSPNRGSTISNTATLTATANASDNIGVRRVDFYVDGSRLLGTAAESPYSILVDTSILGSGTHSFYVKAYDMAGNSATSATIPVTVAGSTAVAGQPEWARQIASSVAVVPLGVASDHANNLVVVGHFNGLADFGGGTMESAASQSGFITKYTAQNGFLWSKVIGTIGTATINAVSIDSHDNIIVVGSFEGTVDLGGIKVITSKSATDIFVAKYDNANPPTLVWARRYGGNQSDVGRAVAVDLHNGSDDVFFAGGFRSTADFGGANLLLTAAGDTDIALVKLSAAEGLTVWAKRLGSAAGELPNGLTVDRSGDVAVTGQALGPIDLGGGLTGDGGIFVAKYSGADGSHRWSKVPGGYAGYGIASDPKTGNIIFTGSFSGSVHIGGGMISTLGYRGICLVAYDSSGNDLWAKSYDVTGDVRGAVSIDGNGHLAITGGSNNGFFIESLTISGSSPPVSHWTRRGGDSGQGFGGSTFVSFDSRGHILLTGSFQSILDLGRVLVAPSASNRDGFVAQYANTTNPDKY